MNTLGVDHGTKSIRFYVYPAEVSFEIDRKAMLQVSLLKEIEKHIALEDIDLVGLTYSMGDGITKITDIKKVTNRGVLAFETGGYIGGGTKVYDEIQGSGLDAVVIPGLHRRIEVLDPRFKALYSHCASAEKVSLSYHACLETGVENLIIADISSNTVTIGIKNGKFFGAIDACLGAIGVFHGPLDLETIRRIDRGEISANQAFYSSGAVKMYPESPGDILEARNERAKLALDSLILSAEMEILSFTGEINPDAIVITGSFGIHEKIFSRLKKKLEEIAHVHRIDGYAAAKGSAEIARDILNGKRDFLGIDVDYAPTLYD
ncbi:MAG: methanogenesis marker 12 protein [Candidatus Hydrothermarchaeales archaeon]